jgi:hypothetical protein
MGERAESDSRIVKLSAIDLLLLNNALNEVLNGVWIDEQEFETRLGASHAEAKRLLRRIGRLIDNQDA